MINTKQQNIAQYLQWLVPYYIDSIEQNKPLVMARIDDMNESYNLMIDSHDKKIKCTVTNGYLDGLFIYEGLNYLKNVKIECTLEIQNKELEGRTDITVTDPTNQFKNIYIMGNFNNGKFSGLLSYSDYHAQYLDGNVVEDS